MNVKHALKQKLEQALNKTYPQVSQPVEVRNSTNLKFGHFQSNLALILSKKLGKKPSEVAQEIITHFDSEGLEKIEVAPNGFINFTLSNDLLIDALKSEDSGKDGTPLKVVVDYSSPNVAKEMHVGHLRSTIIGDTLSRVLEHQGHQVVRQNHVGDWGTQFGMLLEQVDDEQPGLSELTLPELNALYKRARARFDNDFSFKEASQSRVTKLQNGDQVSLENWAQLVKVSLGAFDETYQRLEVKISSKDVKGESFYNLKLPLVVEALEAKGLTEVSNGAVCVFLDGFKTKEGTPLPLIVKKKDDGYGYAATDLAAINYRVDELEADKIIYVVDTRQSLHFEQVFKTAENAGWVKDATSLIHVGFGTVLGEDGKPFKTRSGGTVTLTSLLDQAKEAVLENMNLREHTFCEEEKDSIAHAVSLAAVKFADLRNDLIKDYVFDVKRMVATEGKTGPYLQYAHARLSSLLSKTDVKPELTVISQEAETLLALKLLEFQEILNAVEEKLQPHHLCNYLYELAVAFSSFYEKCPVLKSEGEVLASRLMLCSLTKETLSQGLNLLGISALEKM